MERKAIRVDRIFTESVLKPNADESAMRPPAKAIERRYGGTMVELRGFEPLTFALRTRRSPS